MKIHHLALLAVCGSMVSSSALPNPAGGLDALQIRATSIPIAAPRKRAEAAAGVVTEEGKTFTMPNLKPTITPTVNSVATQRNTKNYLSAVTTIPASMLGSNPATSSSSGGAAAATALVSPDGALSRAAVPLGALLLSLFWL